MKITIVGSGIVGQSTGKVLKMLENDIIFYDIDSKRLDELEKNGYNVIRQLQIKGSEFVFICVPTPEKNGKLDTSIIEKTLLELSLLISNYVIFVIKSTVVPGFSDSIVKKMEKESNKKEGRDFDLIVVPEFLRHWCAVQDSMHPTKIVIGLNSSLEISEYSIKLIKELYEPIKVKKIYTERKTAEFIKLANNAFYSTRISFMNELYRICKRIHINSEKVVQAILASSEDFGTHAMEHGHAFGGACLPKDLDGLISWTKGIGYDAKLLKSVKIINEEMKECQECS